MSSIICWFDATHLYPLLQRSIFKSTKSNSYECNSATGTHPLPEHCRLGGSGFAAVFRIHVVEKKGNTGISDVPVPVFNSSSGLMFRELHSIHEPGSGWPRFFFNESLKTVI